jgi:AraC family transcriptional regulator
MIQLRTGQHFGENKTTLQLQDCVLVEAGCTHHQTVPWHYHENAYFYYHIRGHLREVNRKQSYACMPGTALFHYWNEPHYNTQFSDDSLFYHLEFRKQWFDKYNVNIAQIEGDFQLKNPVYQSLFRKIYQEFKAGDIASNLAIDGLSLQIFAAMIRVSSTETCSQPVWVNKVKEMLNDCIDNNMSLSRLSEETGVHPVHLSREFPRYFQMGFGDYVRHARLEHSRVLLAERKLSITEISFQCGFSDQSHYIRSFRQTYHITPLQYRKRITGHR